METITLTFGDAGENHSGMNLVGKIGNIGSGFNIYDLLQVKEKFENNGYVCELICLNELIKFKLLMYELKYSIVTNNAYILIIRKGIDYFIKEEEGTSKKMFEEMNTFEWDKKYWDTRRSKVLNKHARANVCFGEYNIEPNYEEKQGRIVAYKDVKYLDILRQNLCKMLGKKGENLICEGNRYFDIKKCGIGWHGDSERKKVIGLRLGQKMMFKIRWYFKCNAVSESINIELEDGDMYIMSEKAVGYDWKRSSIYTLRHSAGCEKYTKE
jgi:hypothetical protein